MNTQNTLESLITRLNFYLDYLRKNYTYIQYISSKNTKFFERIVSLDREINKVENWNSYLYNTINKNYSSAKYNSFFDFSDTPKGLTVSDASLSIGSRTQGSLQSVKVLSTSNILSLDDTPDYYTSEDSVVITDSSEISFQDIGTWRSLNMNVLDFSGVAGTGTQVELSGTDLENQMYLLNIGDDTSIRIRFILGTMKHNTRCAFYVYSGTGDPADPSTKFIRSTSGISSYPDWSYANGYHQLNLYSGLLLKYNSSLGFITEGQVYFS